MGLAGGWNGVVVSLNIAPAAGEPTISVEEVRVEVGRGIVGDRYYAQKGTYSDRPGPGREVTLIEIEAIEELKRDLQVEIEPKDARRNIVTRGVPLNHLVGRRFMVGQVSLLGARLCEPCEHLESLTKKGVMGGLVHRGGLRVQVLNNGVIREGDPIREI